MAYRRSPSRRAVRSRTSAYRGSARRSPARSTRRVSRSTARTGRSAVRGQTVRIVIENAPASAVARSYPDASMIGKKEAPKPQKAKF